VDGSDHAFLAQVFERNYIAEGPCATQFREQLLQLTGSPHGVLASNGTLALYLALKGLGIGPGDEVLVQDITFIASANAVEMVGATPRFVDVPAFDDLTLDLDRIALTPRTRGIVVAHLFGTACSNIEALQGFCAERGLRLIEDAAQALAITDGVRHCGTFGDAGTFSFYADKTITTAEGGFVITPHEELHDRMVLLRNQGRRSSGTFVHEAIGYNLRMTDLQCALGLSQLAKLDTIVREKQKLYALYRERLGDRVTFSRIRDDFSHIPFRVVVFVEHAERTMELMKARGVEARAIFHPLHRQPCYAHLGGADRDFPHAVECADRGICLPTWVGLSVEQVDHVCASLLDAIA